MPPQHLFTSAGLLSLCLSSSQLSYYLPHCVSASFLLCLDTLQGLIGLSFFRGKDGPEFLPGSGIWAGLNSLLISAEPLSGSRTHPLPNWCALSLQDFSKLLGGGRRMRLPVLGDGALWASCGQERP